MYLETIKSVAQLGTISCNLFIFFSFSSFSFLCLIEQTSETLKGVFGASTSSETVFIITYRKQHEISWLYPLPAICSKAGE